jgi:hypothetical protein
VTAVVAREDAVFAGGYFTMAGTRPSYNFARWSALPADATEWRSIYFTAAQLADPAISGDAADPDGDGMNNGQEYLAGTNPTSAESVFAVQPTAPSNGSVVVTFTAEANHSYTVQFSDAVTTPPSWQRLANIEARPRRRVETVVDGVPAPGERYYRIITPALP